MTASYVAYGECPACRRPRIVLDGMFRLLPHHADGQPCEGEGELPAPPGDPSKPCTCRWTRLLPSANDLGEPRRTYPDSACPRHTQTEETS